MSISKQKLRWELTEYDKRNAWINEDGTIGYCMHDESRHCCKPAHIKTFSEIEKEKLAERKK